MYKTYQIDPKEIIDFKKALAKTDLNKIIAEIKKQARI